MKNTFNKILLGLALGISLLFGNSSLNAQTVIATNLTAGVTNNLLSGNYIVGSITITAGTVVTPQVLSFYDSATTNIGQPITNQWYSRTTITTNITSVLTNALGTVYTNIYPGQYTVITTNSATTNNLPVIAAIPVLSGSSFTQTRNSFTGQSLLLTGGLTVVVPAGASNVTAIIYANTNSL